jgi:hypothetical protein
LGRAPLLLLKALAEAVLAHVVSLGRDQPAVLEQAARDLLNKVRHA